MAAITPLAAASCSSLASHFVLKARCPAALRRRTVEAGNVSSGTEEGNHVDAFGGGLGGPGAAPGWNPSALGAGQTTGLAHRSESQISGVTVATRDSFRTDK